MIGALRTAFPDIHWVIEEMVGEGEKVFSRFTWHGTHRGEFFGVPATGKQIKESHLLGAFRFLRVGNRCPDLRPVSTPGNGEPVVEGKADV